MEMVQIPRFAVEKAIEALRLNHNGIKSECCLKRMTASAHNLLKVYSKDGVTKEQIDAAILSYMDGDLFNY